jgi:hypothetical protein
MMKSLIVLSFLGCLVCSYCTAQNLDDAPVRAREPVRINTPTFAVTFIPTDTCNLRINDRDQGIIYKNSSKTIYLPLGSHRLLFESLETGETIKKRSFRLTKDSISGARIVYPVTFKQQN